MAPSGRTQTEGNARRRRKTSPERDLLLRLVNSLQIDLGAERSFKVFRNIILANRFLLSTRKDAAPKEKVLDICRRLGLPDPFWAPLLQNLPDTKFVHFGFEENEKGSVYKVYLELISRAAITRSSSTSASSGTQRMRPGAPWPGIPATLPLRQRTSSKRCPLPSRDPDAAEAVEIAKGIVDRGLARRPRISFTLT